MSEEKRQKLMKDIKKLFNKIFAEKEVKLALQYDYDKVNLKKKYMLFEYGEDMENYTVLCTSNRLKKIYEYIENNY